MTIDTLLYIVLNRRHLLLDVYLVQQHLVFPDICNIRKGTGLYIFILSIIIFLTRIGD